MERLSVAHTWLAPVEGDSGALDQIQTMLLLPAFGLSFFFMYWSLPLACLLYRVRFLTFSDRRDDTYRWSQTIAQFFGVRLKKVGCTELYRSDDPVIYLHNHRCWADFFLDLYVTEGRAGFLSRWAVFPVFPVFLSSALLLKSVKFFNRSRMSDKEGFNNWLDNDIALSAVKGLIVYPEGHRSLKKESLPLKRGMLKYAYTRNFPCQVVMTKGKELVMSEKQMSVGFNPQLPLGFSELINTKDFDDFDSFFARIEQVWEQTWRDVHEADVSALTDIVPGAGRDCSTEYPMPVLVGQAAVCITTVALLLGLSVAGLQLVFSSSLAVTLSTIVAGMTYMSVQIADVQAHSVLKNV